MAGLIRKAAVILTAALTLTACSGLPDNLQNFVSAIPTQMATMETQISRSRQYIDGLQKSPEWPFLQMYYQREKWTDYPARASDALAQAKALYEKQIKPMADRDDPKEASAFSRLIAEYRKSIANFQGYVQKGPLRVKFLLNTREAAPDIYKKAKQQSDEMRALTGHLRTLAAKTAAKYPNKTDIPERVASVQEVEATADALMKIVALQYNHIGRGDADYALLGDSAVEIDNKHRKLVELQQQQTAKLQELDRSYTKVLADQQIDYYITIGRASWCNSDGCGNGDTYLYPAAQVDEKAFEFFDTTNVATIAKYSEGLFSNSFDVLIPEPMWQALKINPKMAWNSRHAQAEYWVEKTFTKTYHRYLVIENGKRHETDWQQVPEKYFWDHQEDLGLAIVTKPYGYYEEEAIKVGQPAGMAMIAEPTVVNGVPRGANQYGEWRQHSDGHSFWYYYGMYRLLGDVMGGPRHYYSYNDYMDYRRHRGQPYYGRQSEWGTYGSSTYSNSRYRQSTYAGRNPSVLTGGRSSRTGRSVRGAGATSRGRGPGGGGK